MYSIYKESERDDILLVHIFYIFQCSASMKKDVSFVTFVGEELLALLMTNEQFFFNGLGLQLDHTMINIFCEIVTMLY